LEFPEGEEVADLLCGGYHCLAMTKSGKVYEWGRVYTSETSTPTLVVELQHEKIKQLAAGHEHNIAITGILIFSRQSVLCFFSLRQFLTYYLENGEVYSWGSILNGKLGRVNITDEELEAKESRPKKVVFPPQGEPVVIVDGDCGGDFTVLLDCMLPSSILTSLFSSRPPSFSLLAPPSYLLTSVLHATLMSSLHLLLSCPSWCSTVLSPS
jgi:alpha-tubulin suppressor-like RCC1 family protein